MKTLEINPSCNEEAQPTAARSRTDSWCPPLDDTLLRRRNVALMAAAVSEAVAPLVGQQLEQLEASLRRLLCEHTAQLNRVQATLQSVEHTVVSRCSLRGSIKSTRSASLFLGESETRTAAPSPSPSTSKNLKEDDGGQPRRSRTPSKGSCAGSTQDSPNSPDSTAQSSQSPNQSPSLPPAKPFRKSEQLGRMSSRTLLDCSSPSSRMPRSVDVSPHPMMKQGVDEGNTSGNESTRCGPFGPGRRRRRASSPGLQMQKAATAGATFLLGTAETGEHRISITEPAPEIKPSGSFESNPSNPSKDSNNTDDSKNSSQAQPSQNASLPQQPVHREKKPSGELKFKAALSDPSKQASDQNDMTSAPDAPSVAPEGAVAEQLAGAAAALAALPSPEREPSPPDPEGSLEVRVSQIAQPEPPGANPEAEQDDSPLPKAEKPSRTSMRRAKSDSFQQNQQKKDRQNRKGGKDPDSPATPDAWKKKPIRRQKSEADAFRARFATSPAGCSSDDVENDQAPQLAPAPYRRSSLSDRSSRTISKSPDKMYDVNDRTSPHATHHFDLYSLEQLHSARLLELEVGDESPHKQYVSNPWSAVGSMLPMRHDRQDSPEGRYDRQQALAATKVVPDPDEGKSSINSRKFILQRQCSQSHESVASSGSEMSEAFAVHDVKASTRNLDDLRRRHDHKLTSSELHHDDEQFIVTSPEGSDMGEDEDDRVNALQWRTRIALCICGVVPFPGRGPHGKMKASTWYQNIVLLLAVLSAVFTTVQGLLGKGLLAEDDENSNRALEWRWYLGSLPFSVGSVIGLVIMRAGRVQKLVRFFPGPLEAYAYRHGFVDIWSHHASRRLLLLVSFWVFVVLVRLCSDVLLLKGIDYAAWDNLLLLVSFMISSSIFLALIIVQLYIFSILGMMVDQFCFKFFDCPDVSQGIQEWNVIQAILRHVTSAFDTCFLATQTSALTALLLSATQLLQVDLNEGSTRQTIGYIAGVFLPPVLMACGAGSLFFIAAEVTEKCSRVPALLNSVMCGGDDMLQHEKRHCIVQYVTYSAAGFYMKEVRLTASMALKLTYITALGAYFVLTKIAADSATMR